jgi:tetratricopeptide (TPR) repeat protein
MKTINKLLIAVLTFLTLAASAYAETPREQLQQMAEQLQKTPNDNALREKIIKLSTSIKPAPAIPEQAREPFVMGATVLKKASDPTGASKAVDLFTQALNVAPWFADAYYNRAIAHESAGQYESAIDDIKLYLGFKLTDTERREAQDKVYALKADAQLASAKKAEQDKIAGAAAAEKERRVQRLQGTWVNSEDGGRFVSYWKAQTAGDTIKLSADRYVTASETMSVSGDWGEFRLKAENGEFKGIYVEGTQKRACTGRESPSRATISADGLEMTVTTTLLYTDRYVDSNNEGHVDLVNCRYSPQPEWRMVMRKQ